MADSNGCLMGTRVAEKVLAAMDKHHVLDAPGDVLEIGVFMGAFTRMLCEWSAGSDKWVYAIDPFDLDTDPTCASLYHDWIGEADQWDAYQETTRDCTNLVTRRMNSRDLVLRGAYCAAFVDGSHLPEDVAHDFWVCWNHLVAGGGLFLHDYRHDLPQVTETIDQQLDHLKGRYRVALREDASLVIIKGAL